MRRLNYEIGSEYRYPNSKNKFRLKSTNGFRFEFECGKWCTDNVFAGLVNVKTGVQVYKDTQLKLNF